jgi:hypothetical protein
MSYKHAAVVVHKIAEFDSTLNDYVITQIHFILFTADLNNNLNVNSGNVIAVLDSPDPLNFIPYVQITKQHLYQWIDQNYDVVALQDSNISKFA